jgi:F-type H+-transporting ATPase subunit b
VHIDPLLVLLQAIPFFVTVIGLNVLIFRPAMELLAAREENVDGFKARAAGIEADTARRLAELEAKLQDARNRAGAERARLRADAIRAEEGILDECRKRVELELDGARQRLAADRTHARMEIRRIAQDLSVRAASAVLGRPVSE